MLFLSLIALSLSVSGFNSVQAQEEVLAPAAAPATTGSDWNIISRSSTTVYMTDVNAIRQQDGVTTGTVARVPASGEASDQTHSVTVISFRCGASQAKSGEEIYYGADGSIEERIPNDYDFEPIATNSLDDYVKGVVCGGERATRSYPSVAAFIAAGRPARD